MPVGQPASVGRYQRMLLPNAADDNLVDLQRGKKISIGRLGSHCAQKYSAQLPLNQKKSPVRRLALTILSRTLLHTKM